MYLKLKSSHKYGNKDIVEIHIKSLPEDVQIIDLTETFLWQRFEVGNDKINERFHNFAQRHSEVLLKGNVPRHDDEDLNVEENEYADHWTYVYPSLVLLHCDIWIFFCSFRWRIVYCRATVVGRVFFLHLIRYIYFADILIHTIYKFGQKLHVYVA